MNPKTNWKVEFEHELRHATSARRDGNEGMARVCARRAAGAVIGEYLSRRGYKRLDTGAYNRLVVFTSLPDVDEALKGIASHFLLRVDPDRSLPLDVDLISEAETLEKILLLENTD